MSLPFFFDVSKKLFLKIFELPREYKIRFYLLIFTLIVGLVCSGLAPLLFRDSLNMISESQKPGSFYLIFFLLASYATVWMINQIACIISWLIWQRPSNRISAIICEQTLTKLLQLPLEYFSTHDSRIAVTSVEKTFQTIPSIFSNIIIHIIPAITEMLLSLIIFFFLYGFVYGIILITLFLGFILTIILSVRLSKKVDISFHKKLDDISVHVYEVINNAENIKSFAAEDYEISIISKLLNEFENIAARRSLYLDGAQATQTFFCGITLLIFTCSSGYAVYKGVMSPGDFVLINTYFIQFSIPITFLGYVFAELYRDISSLGSTFKLKEIYLENDEIGVIKELEKDCDVEFKNVVIKNKEKKNILNKISFKIEAGKRLVIVGPSGSGKSTCIRLLLKLLKVDEGNILIGGKDINEINTRALREQIGIVVQDSTIFYGTIKENIIYNSKNISDEILNNAIKLAGLEKLVASLPDGVNSSVEGIMLSGGEKQRISFARAIIRQPKIFIFDEPTSALDNENEQEIYDSIKHITKGITNIIVTHRLTIARDADLIIVLQDGNIVEVGKHDSLMENDELYKNLWEQQCLI